MIGMEVQVAFVVLLMFATTVNADEVTFQKDKIYLTCPFDGVWYHEEKKLTSTNRTYELKYDGPVLYICKDTEQRQYMFYVKGFVCRNCLELDATIFIVAITADVIVSTILMIIIYKCNKKTSPAVAPHPAKSPVKAAGRAPPVPHPDYAPLNPNTRSMDTYSTVVTKMG